MVNLMNKFYSDFKYINKENKSKDGQIAFGILVSG